MNFAKFRTIIYTGSALAGLLVGGTSAACTFDGWKSGGNGSAVNIIATQPNGLNAEDADGNAVSPELPRSRFSGLCGSFVEASTQGYVQDDRPGGISQIIARFYVFASDYSGSGDLYEGYDSAGNDLFTVSFNNGNAVLAAGAASVSSALNVGWNAIEIEWDPTNAVSNPGTLSLSVNGGAAQTSSASIASAGLDHVRLGNLASVNTRIHFDAYEAHLTTPVGTLLIGDANNSGTVNGADIGAIIAELSGTLQTGQPDCNVSGIVNGADIGCVIELL